MTRDTFLRFLTLRTLANGAYYTAREITEAHPISQSRVHQHLRNMVRCGYLRRRGKEKHYEWRLTNLGKINLKHLEHYVHKHVGVTKV